MDAINGFSNTAWSYAFGNEGRAQAVQPGDTQVVKGALEQARQTAVESTGSSFEDYLNASTISEQPRKPNSDQFDAIAALIASSPYMAI